MTTIATPTPDRYERRSARELTVLDADLPALARILSTNNKTGYSVNLPIAQTCDPSSVCRRVCYACDGWFVKSVVQRKALAVLRWFQATPTALAVATLARECDRAGLAYLRWNGSGDLVRSTVAVINAMAARHPGITHVVYSRKPYLIGLLAERPNIVVNVSLDASSLDLPAQITRRGVRYTYLRETAADIPPAWSETLPIEVVFPVVERGLAAIPHDPRDCAADSGRMPLDGACARCLRCYRHPDETFPIYRRTSAEGVGH